MNAIVFRNKGVIDPRAITTFGTSSKENANAIGFFGTGLKYAIAVILRLGGSITIHSGKKVYEFGTRKTTIRVNKFDVVTMNRRALGFTTELGKTWAGWMAFRELWCNAKDEGGEALFTTNPDLYTSGLVAFPTPDDMPNQESTVIVVRGDAILDAWEIRDTVVLTSEPLHVRPGLAVHPGKSKYVFYRGIRVHELQKPSEFTYNILARIDLTEDRTAKYSWDITSTISRNLATLDHPETLRHILTTSNETFEHSLSYEGQTPSDEFTQTVTTLARAFDARLNVSADKLVRMLTMEAMITAGTEGLTLTSTEQAQLDKALTFCSLLGYHVETYPIVIVEFLGDGVLGRADIAQQRIYLARRTFMVGTKNVAGTLVEEYLHLKHGLSDESRAMQNYLLDALMSMGERLAGVPL